MNEQKALDLVMRYSHHTRSIKALTKQLCESLDACTGLDGARLDVNESGYPIHPRDTDEKARDTSTHLWKWYTPDWQGDHGEHPVYEDIGEWSAKECPHCYAAHLAIQDRKEHRKKLGSVKAAMTKGGAA